MGVVVEECARDLVAAEYRHTTARSVVVGEMPDPQLHSHVVITAAVREDGRFVAVASRPVFRSARDAGAFYRSALAQRVVQLGFQVNAGTATHGRYFEIAGEAPGAAGHVLRSVRTLGHRHAGARPAPLSRCIPSPPYVHCQPEWRGR